MSRRLLILGCLVALSMPALSAGAENPVVAAARKAAAAKTVTAKISMVIRAPGVPQVLMRGRVEQEGATSAYLTMELVSGGQVVPLEMIMLVEAGHAVMYMKSSLFAAQLPPGKQWLRVDLDAAASTLGVDFSSLLGSASTLAPLEHGLQATRKLRREKVAGVTTTRYRATLNVAKAAAAVPEYGKQVRAVEKATGIKLRTVRYDVWVDGKGRMRRVAVTTPVPVGTAKGTMAMTITYTKFDAAVVVKAPRPDLVLNAPS